MTWPDAIALAIGVTTLYLLTHHQRAQHRSKTEQAAPQDGEHRS